eukprot:CAMPEP_0179009514 /NCGR_PEP_ID=MMETSP0795-20121207/16313_1 /TAXON_ID=88552 /ORGANISM="Amoebophrya sp., Strain Ameob2" /LENGTH=368 /DNA_ID=CAMNT_0020704717 /DNA_START=1084 /DNA_END=2191 /DNA_ORIENTATION=+
MDQMVEAYVKSYNASSRYGFLGDVPGVAGDVRFRRDDLPGQLYNENNLVGHMLRFEVRQNQEGKHYAENIQDPTSVPTFRGQVKSWNSDKNFGFIQCPETLLKIAGDKKDIFMAGRHIIGTEHHGIVNLGGKTAMFSVEKSAQGLSATHIRFPELASAGQAQAQALAQQIMMGAMNMMGMPALVLPERPRSQTNALKRILEDDKLHDYQKRRRGMLPQGRVNGAISSFVKGKYGFIRSEVLDAEIFFPAEEGMDLKKGDPCSFEIGLDEKSGKLRANEVSHVLVSGTASRGSSPQSATVFGGASNPFYSGENGSMDHFQQAREGIAHCTLQELQELNVILAQQIAHKSKGGMGSSMGGGMGIGASDHF